MIAAFVVGLVLIASLAGVVGAYLVDDRRERAERAAHERDRRRRDLHPHRVVDQPVDLAGVLDVRRHLGEAAALAVTLLHQVDQPRAGEPRAGAPATGRRDRRA